MFEGITNVQVIVDLILSIDIVDLILSFISAIIVVPIVLWLTHYFEFNEYLRLLLKEINSNLDSINGLPGCLDDVRSGKREWLPGVGSNQPKPGYVTSYLSMNLYNNFKNQKYWLYLQGAIGIKGGPAGRLAEFYEYIQRYCDIIQHLQTLDENGKPIPRNLSEYVMDPNYYNEKRFYYTTITLPQGFDTNLMETTKKIKEISLELNLKDINSYKDPQWWYPYWLKER